MSDTINIRDLGSGAIGILEQEIVKRDATIAELRSIQQQTLEAHAVAMDVITQLRAEIEQLKQQRDGWKEEANRGIGLSNWEEL